MPEYFFIVDFEQVFIILITFLSSSFAEKLEFGAHFKKQNKTKKIFYKVAMTL